MSNWIRIALLGGFLALGTWACDDGDSGDDNGGNGSGNGDNGGGSSCTMETGGHECLNGMCRCQGSDGDYTLTEEQAESQCKMTVPCEGGNNSGGGDNGGGTIGGGDDNGGGLPGGGDDFGGGDDDFDF